MAATGETNKPRAGNQPRHLLCVGNGGRGVVFTPYQQCRGGNQGETVSQVFIHHLRQYAAHHRGSPGVIARTAFDPHPVDAFLGLLLTQQKFPEPFTGLERIDF